MSNNANIMCANNWEIKNLSFFFYNEFIDKIQLLMHLRHKKVFLFFLLHVWINMKAMNQIPPLGIQVEIIFLVSVFN